jgi:hypothetical protein
MEREIKEKIELTIFDANSVLALCFVDKEMGNSLLEHIKPLTMQIKIIDGLLDLMNPLYVEQFHLSDQIQQCQVIGYRLYRMLMEIQTPFD